MFKVNLTTVDLGKIQFVSCGHYLNHFSTLSWTSVTRVLSLRKLAPLMSDLMQKTGIFINVSVQSVVI